MTGPDVFANADWVMVPRKPTEEMAEAFYGLADEEAMWPVAFEDAWSAMLSASPAHVAVSDDVREEGNFVRAARDFYDAGPKAFAPGYEQYGDLLHCAEKLVALASRTSTTD